MLTGKVAVITGSTSGIGYGMAKVFAQNGAQVVLHGLGKPDAIEKLRADLEQETGAPCDFVPADMQNPDEIRAMIDQVGNKFGRLDILVNNAGIQHVDPAEKFPIDKWDAVIALTISRFSCGRTGFAMDAKNIGDALSIPLGSWAGGVHQ